MKHIFFTMNDFSKEGGGTIRMQGILNELSNKGQEVILVSNTISYSSFHQFIEHVPINYLFSRRDKRVFQFLLTILPITIVNLKFEQFLHTLKDIYKNFPSGSKFYFFEYLDNSIGYWLKSNKIITSYINDLHGVATIEFSFQALHASNYRDKIRFRTKSYISDLLDKKVFTNAGTLIFASEAMRHFYIKKYKKVRNIPYFILPYVLSSKKRTPVDQVLKQELVGKYSLSTSENIFLFAGAFKKIGGVPDLIKAYHSILPGYKNTKLILVGDGPTFNECTNLIEQLQLHNNVYLAGRIPYNQLTTYQDVADVIVCPDKKNMYSECIIHVKYLEALASGKIVINGDFSSVREINKHEKLSLLFQPDNLESLAEKMKQSIEDHEDLLIKYADSAEYTLTHLTYNSCINVLMAKPIGGD